MGRLRVFLPWVMVAALSAAFFVYFMSSEKHIAIMKIELEAAAKKLQENEKNLADVRIKLQAKDEAYTQKEREYQDLKLLYLKFAAPIPALHVIGVYEGETPPGGDDRPWWAKCGKGDPGVMSREDKEQCFKRYAGQKLEKEVYVDVSDTSRPIVLAFTAYDKTHWKVRMSPGVDVKRVILGGYHAQRISGVSNKTPIEVFTYDSTSCPLCAQSGRYFYSYESPPLQLREITGLEVTSFQGRYKGSFFSIFPGIKGFPMEKAVVQD